MIMKTDLFINKKNKGFILMIYMNIVSNVIMLNFNHNIRNSSNTLKHVLRITI